ncbi:MAG: hypothetical protein HC829_08330 [Bacteroidales bacterium]|nr:hypothetical protein [Bacteroidales bacterium]
MADIIDVKAAIRNAIAYLQNLSEFVTIKGLRLEETEFDEGDSAWLITLSTIEPPKGLTAMAATEAMRLMEGLEREKRIYKLFRIDARTGEVKSMKVRTLQPIE